MMGIIMKLKKKKWIVLIGILCVWCVVLNLFGKTGRAVIIIEDKIVSNGPYCGVKVYVMNNGTCLYEYQEGSSKSKGKIKYAVNKEKRSISFSYNYPIGVRYVDFSFDFGQKEYEYSYQPIGSDFERFEITKADWNRIPSLFED